MVTTATKIGKYAFDNCLMNASGIHCSNAKELNEVDQSLAGTFVTKTATLKPREGNPEPRFDWDNLGSINSMGLPNLGLDYYLDYAEKKENENPDKPYFLSVTGLTEEEIHQVLNKVNASSFHGLTELNLSCPNVPGKPLTGYDFEQVEKILTKAFTYFTKPLGVKLPAYFDGIHFDQIANVLNKFPLTFVTTINSVGQGLWINDETTAIKPQDGFGGIGGKYVKATALGNVHALYKRLKPEIQIIGVGGVSTGRDAFEHILCGASMVQIGTSLPGRGPEAKFKQVTEELEAIMKEKDYASIEEFKGKLKYLN